MGRAVDRGACFKLKRNVVRTFPMYFAVIIPVGDVIREIER